MNENLTDGRPFLLVALAGGMGAAGVALAARAAHGSGNTAILNTAALFLIIHAGVLVAIAGIGVALRQFSAFPHTGKLLVCGWVLGLGTSLFSLDLAWRGLQNQSLFAGAAPIGGSLIILGWLLLTVWGTVVYFTLGKYRL